MRKSPLQRRTPLKRSTKPLKKSRLKQSSQKKTDWNKRYKEQHESDSSYQRCARTGMVRLKEEFDRHHPFGRNGKYILVYVYIERSFHDYIHKHSKWASEEAVAWIQPPFRGRPYNPDSHRPWLPGTLIGESNLK